MGLLEYNDPCKGDQHLGFDGRKGYDRWIDLGLEEGNAEFTVDALKEEYGIETSIDELVNENIDWMFEKTHDMPIAQTILEKKDGIYMIEEQYHGFDVFSFSCKEDFD